jgi:hypothetical protein
MTNASTQPWCSVRTALSPSTSLLHRQNHSTHRRSVMRHVCMDMIIEYRKTYPAPCLRATSCISTPPALNPRSIASSIKHALRMLQLHHHIVCSQTFSFFSYRTASHTRDSDDTHPLSNQHGHTLRAQVFVRDTRQRGGREHQSSRSART